MSEPLPTRDSEYYLQLQTHTGWGRTLHHFAQWCSPLPGWRTLDVGCGPGLLPAIFSNLGCKACGVDLDPLMFVPAPLHSSLVVADMFDLPLKRHAFDLITCSNVLFLISAPELAMVEMSEGLASGGKLALLNPSEHLDPQSAETFAIARQLDGLARATLINWAKRATQNHRWTEAETEQLFLHAGLTYGGSVLKVGPGFARFSWGTRSI